MTTLPTFPRWLLDNGVTRPLSGPCPACGAAPAAWCVEPCPLIDPKDFR